MKPYWLALDEGALTAEEVRELNVGPGDECYMVGRLATHGGRLTNSPVARFGNIALMPTKAETIS